MSTGLLDIMKRASLDATNNAQMCDIRYGTVISTSPLRVRVTNQFTIPESLLVVPKHLGNGGGSGGNDSGTSNSNTSIAFDKKTQTLIINTTNNTKTTKNNDNTDNTDNGLTKGDKVALLRKQGGQSYFILGRI